MYEGHNQAIHQLLTARGLIGPAAPPATPAGTGGRSYAATLIALGLLDQAVLLRAVAEHLGAGYDPDPPAALPAEALALLDGSLARAYGVAPVSADRRSVALLAADPFNPSLADNLAFALGREVRIVVADPARVLSLIRRHYGEAADAATSGEMPAAIGEADLERLAGQPPVIHFVNLVLTQAIRDRASDIHFEPFEHGFKIRYRIDGVLHEMSPPPGVLARPVISRVKVMAGLNIAECRLPQDGRIPLTLAGHTVDLRVSTLPTSFGESVVLRVLDQSSVRLELARLGLPAAMHAELAEIIRRPNGILLVTGPTGSGKTTTLYSCLAALNTVDAKLLTVEDPVEYEIDGVMQVPVNPGAGLTFARALRTFLRQDPDIVMVGEIRDLETAQIALQAALTGHLVLSTLHTNDAPSAVTRLVEMGIEPFLLASTLEAVLAQRLVRRVCSACKTVSAPPDAWLRQLGTDRTALAGRPCYAGAGCPACHHTGYQGRLGIFEFLRMTDPLRELLVQGVSLLQLRRHAAEQGMTSLRAAGLAAVFAGETTIDEVLKYL
jgi:type IV pilus assembly protein PilB